MKKIECHISDEKSDEIDKICDKEGYTRAEFNRRALEAYLWNITKGLVKNVTAIDSNDK
jgi:hypothetical protein